MSSERPPPGLDASIPLKLFNRSRRRKRGRRNGEHRARVPQIRPRVRMPGATTAIRHWPTDLLWRGFAETGALPTTQYPEIEVGDEGKRQPRVIPDHFKSETASLADGIANSGNGTANLRDGTASQKGLRASQKVCVSAEKVCGSVLEGQAQTFLVCGCVAEVCDCIGEGRRCPPKVCASTGEAPAWGGRRGQSCFWAAASPWREDRPLLGGTPSAPASELGASGALGFASGALA